MFNFSKIIDQLGDSNQNIGGHQRMSYRDCYVYPPSERHKCKARERRLTAFESVPGLIEVLDIDSPKHQSIRRSIKGHLDHTSFWEFLGTPIVLNEPYYGQLSDYQTQGLAAVELPDEIAPYCGFWGATPGPRPGTKSFLITNAVSERKLQKLLQILKEIATHMPPWNQV